MHHGNHYYGHAQVLAGYCGLDPDDPPRIQGYLQHGWNVMDGLGGGTPYAPGSPIFVWSERTRRRAWSMGRPLATVTGAPFLYLLRSESDRADEGEREGTIWYPFHGWEGQRVSGDHLRLIDTQRSERGWSGFVVTNPNCSAIVLTLALAPLHRAFGLRRVFVTTLQAVSGAGFKPVVRCVS